MRWMCKRRSRTTSIPERLLLHLHCRTEAHLYICLKSSEIFRVDEETDVLTDDKLYKHWNEFQESDKSELKQFIDEKVFRKVKLSDLPETVVLVDATWVRKFKRLPSGSLKAKSRLCARGFLDPQKNELPTRSTTATRLSQRIVLSMVATHQLDLRSWDISGAFRKGFSFEKVRKTLRQRGVISPERRVVVIPPPNVWRHLSSMDETFYVTEEDFGYFGLECLKPAYGLNDAPLAWQVCLHESLEESGGQQSVLDEKDAEGSLRAIITTHVDDIAVAADDQFMKEQYAYARSLARSRCRSYHSRIVAAGIRRSRTATRLISRSLWTH